MTPARIRQVVLAARDLDAVAARLRSELGLGEQFSDPAVGHFGLRNAVFALQDAFLEVISPTRPDTAAGRLLERRGGDCGYMVMFQVDDIAAARRRAADGGVREVFDVTLPDIEEVHLHPADIGAAIVSLSSPHPPDAWRWGGPRAQQRAAPLTLDGITVAADDPGALGGRWEAVLGEAVGVSFVTDPGPARLVQVRLAGSGAGRAVSVAGVRFELL